MMVKMTKEIPLTKGMFALVDDDDFSRVNEYKWCAHQDGGRWYSFRYFSKDGQRTFMSLHRFIIGTPVGMETDHINGNGLDNRKCNVRICTRNQNQANKSKSWGKHSKYKGVSYAKNRQSPKRWFAQIVSNNKHYHCGYYLTEIEAAKAYNENAIKFFGEFARLNEVI